MAALDNQFEHEGKIGVREILEIDECKIGQRKYERRRVVDNS